MSSEQAFYHMDLENRYMDYTHDSVASCDILNPDFPMSLTSFSPLDCLAELLRARIAFNHVLIRKFPVGYETSDEIITTHRFMLVLRGELHYTVEGRMNRARVGQQIFVPAWARRSWRPRPGTTCECIWCEFSAAGFDLNLHTLFLRTCKNPGLERATLERMLKLWPGERVILEVRGRSLPESALPRESQLRLEGELKAMLARFWPEAVPGNPTALIDPVPGQTIHPDLKHALLWMNENFWKTDALKSLYEEINLSPNHFRLLFVRVLGCSPQSYLIHLRLRRARSLVLDSDKLIKEIAAFVGFSDPLFFSRQYLHFWGKSPRADREQSNA